MENSSDERFRAYFLGKLPAEEAELFEMECAASAESTERARACEKDLTDDYLRGFLSADDRRLFESNYLSTDARQNRLRAARGLRAIVAGAGEEKPREAVTAAEGLSWRQSVSGGAKALKFAFGAIVLLLLCGGLAFYLSGSKTSENETTRLEPPPLSPVANEKSFETSAPENDPPPAEQPENSAVQNSEIVKNTNATAKNEPTPKIAATPKTVGQNRSAAAVFTLLPGTLRGEGEQFINVAREAKTVGLQLKLPEDAGKYQIYRADLKSAEGDSVMTAPNLKSLNFSIPAAKLENRTYLIFLEGKNAAGEFEPVAEYTFRARR